MTRILHDDPVFFEGYNRLGRSIEHFAGAPGWPALRALLPEPEDLRVVDLACGFGWFCRWVRDHGAAHVLGLDLSERTLARARVDTADGTVKHHRTMGTTLNLLIRQGFAIRHVEERGPTDTQATARPELAVERDRPMFQLVAAGR